MSKTLTWDVEEKIKFGHCGPDLRKIVMFRLPYSSGFSNGGMSESPERDSNYAIFDERLDSLRDLDIPEGEKGYALEYTEMEKSITMEEAGERLRKQLEKHTPKDINGREVYIQARVDAFVGRGPVGRTGLFFGGDLADVMGGIPVPTKKFVRWVSREEYESRLLEAQAQEGLDDDEVYFLDAWYYLLDDEEKKSKCLSCPLSTYLGEEKDLEKITVSKVNCHKSSSSSHWGTFFDFIAEHGEFEVLRRETFFDGDSDGIPVERLEQLEEELIRSRTILESVELPAMNVYDLKGDLKFVYSHDTGWVYGNRSEGYGLGLDGNEGILVVHKTVSVLDLPKAVKSAVLEEEGLDGILSFHDQLKRVQPKFYFSEIVREGETFYGTTLKGCKIELLAEEDDRGNKLTPFSSFEKDGQDVGRIEYSKILAMNSFEFLQKLLEKHLKIAKEYDIPIQIS